MNMGNEDRSRVEIAHEVTAGEAGVSAVEQVTGGVCHAIQPGADDREVITSLQHQWLSEG